MSDREQTTRRYVDRRGRVITDPAAIQARSILQHLRGLNTRGRKAGRPWERTVTVGELAAAVKLTAEQVVAVIRAYDMWLWGLIEEGPMESWWVFEDGE